MARGNHLSLEEARRMGRLDRFCREHPSEGDKAQFDDALEAIASGKPPKERKRDGDATGQTGTRGA